MNPATVRMFNPQTHQEELVDVPGEIMQAMADAVLGTKRWHDDPEWLYARVREWKGFLQAYANQTFLPDVEPWKLRAWRLRQKPFQIPHATIAQMLGKSEREINDAVRMVQERRSGLTAPRTPPPVSPPKLTGAAA
jgi:hypothetical protein